MPRLLITATPAIITAAAAAAVASLPGGETVLAIYWAVASRLKRDRCLLPASGTRDCCALRISPPAVSSSTAAALFVLLRCAARPAAFRRRIATFPEKCLIFARKREFLSAVATGQLQILCHKTLSSPLSTLRHDSGLLSPNTMAIDGLMVEPPVGAHFFLIILNIPTRRLREGA